MGRPFRAAPERQRGSRMGTEAAQVPAQRSGAACPDGAVTAGDWGWTDEGRKTFRAAPERQRGFRKENRSSEGAGAAKRSRMPRRGCHRQVTGGRQTKVARPSGPHRSVSEVSGRGTEAAQVPAERSGAACPTGAVTLGDWG